MMDEVLVTAAATSVTGEARRGLKQ